MQAMAATPAAEMVEDKARRTALLLACLAHPQASQGTLQALSHLLYRIPTHPQSRLSSLS